MPGIGNPFSTYEAAFGLHFTTEMAGQPEKLIAYLDRLSTALALVRENAALTDKTVASTFTNMGKVQYGGLSKLFGGSSAMPLWGAGNAGALGTMWSQIVKDPGSIAGHVQQYTTNMKSFGSAAASELTGGRFTQLGRVRPHHVFNTQFQEAQAAGGGQVYGYWPMAKGGKGEWVQLPHDLWNLDSRGFTVRGQVPSKAWTQGDTTYYGTGGYKGFRFGDKSSPSGPAVPRFNFGEIDKGLRILRDSVNEAPRIAKAMGKQAVASEEAAKLKTEEARKLREQARIDERWQRKYQAARYGDYESTWQRKLERWQKQQEQAALKSDRESYLNRELGYGYQRDYHSGRFQQMTEAQQRRNLITDPRRMQAYDDFLAKSQEMRGTMSGVTRAQLAQHYDFQQRLVDQYGFSPKKAQATALAGAGRFIGARGFSEDMNLFARTAVAMSILYGVQGQVRATVGSARFVEQGLAQIGGITGQDFPGQGGDASRIGMRAGIFRISSKYGVPAKDVLNTLETVFQASDLPTQEALRISKVSAGLSRATGQPMAPITDILMDAVNAFRLAGDQIDQFAASLFEARTKGVIEFGEISSGAGKVFQAARLSGFLGLQGDDGLMSVMAMLAAATRQGGTGATASTAVARFIEDIGKPKTIEKLRGFGINAPTPFERIEQVIARERATRAAGEPSFIATSGAFSRIQSRRGGSVLADQWKLVESMRGVEGDIEHFNRAVDKTLDTSTARWERWNQMIENTRTLIGTDLIREFDSLLKPVQAITDAMQTVGSKYPAVGFATGAARGVGTAALGYGMMGLGTQLAGRLFGAELGSLSILNKQGNWLSGLHPWQMGVNLKGLYHTMIGDQAGLRALQQGVEQTNAARLAGMSGTQAAMAGGTAGAGALGWAMVAMAAKYALDTGMGQWADFKALQASQAQDKFEESSYNFTNLVNISRSSRQAIRGGKSGEIGKGEAFDMLMRSMAELKELAPDVADKYGVVVDQSNRLIEVNGLVASSFDQISGSILNLTEGALKEGYIDTLKKAEESIKMQQQALEANRNREISGNVSISGLVSGIIGLGVWATHAFKGEDWTSTDFKGMDFWNAAFGTTQYELSKEELAQQLKDIQEAIAKALGEGLEGEEERNVLESESLVEAEKVYEGRQKIADNVRNQLEVMDSQLELARQSEGLTDEQVAERRKQLRKDILMSAAASLLETNVGDTADLSAWLKDNFQEFADLLAPVIQHTREMAENAKKIKDVMARLATELPNVAALGGDVQAALSIQATQRSRALQVGTGLASLVNSRWKPGIQPVADILMRGKLAQVGLETNMANLMGGVTGYQTTLRTIGSEREEWYNKQAIIDQAIAEVMADPSRLSYFSDVLSGLPIMNGVNDANITAMNQQRTQARTNMEQEWNRQRQAALRALQGGAAPVTDSLMQMLGIPFELRSVFQNTEFDPKDLPQLRQLMADPFLTQNQFARSPKAVWQNLRTMPAYNAMVGLDSGFNVFDQALQGLFTGENAFADWSAVAKAPMDDPRITKFYESLFALMQQSAGGQPGEDLITSLRKITDDFRNIDTETMSSIKTGFTSVDEALKDLAEAIHTRTALFTGDQAMVGEGFRPPEVTTTVPAELVSSRGVWEAANKHISDLGGYWEPAPPVAQELAMSTEDIQAKLKTLRAQRDAMLQQPHKMSDMQMLVQQIKFYERHLDARAGNRWIPYGQNPSELPTINADTFYENFGHLMPTIKGGAPVSIQPSADAVAQTKSIINGLGAYDPSTGCVIKTRDGVAIFTKDSPEYQSIMDMFNSTASVGAIAPKLEANPLTPGTSTPSIGDFMILERPGSRAGHSGYYMGRNEAGEILMSGNGQGSVWSTGYKDFSSGSYKDRDTAGLWAYVNPASPVRQNMASVEAPIVAANTSATDANTAALNANTVALGGTPAQTTAQPTAITPIAYDAAGNPIQIDAVTGAAPAGNPQFTPTQMGDTKNYGDWVFKNSWDCSSGQCKQGWYNTKTKQFVDRAKNPDFEPPYTLTPTGGGDMEQYFDEVNVSGNAGQEVQQEPQKPPKLQFSDVLVGSFVSAIDAFFQAAQTGSIKEAIDAGFNALGQSLAQGIRQMIIEAMPGPGGQILGAIGGGLISLLFGRVFGRSKATKQNKIPVIAEIENWPDFFKAWTLPSSRYMNPNSWNSGNGSFTQNNNISITGTPKLASKVQRALTEPQFLSQVKRRNV